MSILKKASLSTDTPIFAYLRRSTSKEEQAESLVQQEDGIGNIVKRLGLEKDRIIYFAETYSGFENKKRKKFGELLVAVDASKTPCIILTRDVSRLSRNPTDSQAIMDRLYGDNKRKRLIDKIFSLDYEKIKEWNSNTDKEEVHRALSSSYYDSLDTRRKSLGGILLKLGDHQFPYAAPKGLSKHIYGSRQILKQNEQMIVVRRAFEMKTEGKTHKEISKYLKVYGGISMGERQLTDRIFRNTIYIGEYTEKNTGVVNTLEFLEKEPPISRELWERVQKCFGRKISQYGEKQEGHLLNAKIKSESGHVFSKYNAKGKYPTYKGKYKDASGREQFIHMTEKNVLEAFMGTIHEMVIGFTEKFLNTKEIVALSVDLMKGENATINSSEIYSKYKKWEDNDSSCTQEEIDSNPLIRATDDMANKDALSKEGRNYLLKNSFSSESEIIEFCRKKYEKEKNDNSGIHPDKISENEYYWKTLIDTGVNERRKLGIECSYDPSTGYNPLLTIAKTFDILNVHKSIVGRSVAIESISETLKKQFDENSKEFRIARDNQINRLQKQKEDIEQERKNYRREALKMGYSREEIEEASNDMDNDIKVIDSQILEMSKSTEIELYLERLPEILLKTVELGSKHIGKAKIDGYEADLKKLIELTTVELTITNKKDLKVKVFDVLDILISRDKSILEASMGVEPISTALQAAV